MLAAYVFAGLGIATQFPKLYDDAARFLAHLARPLAADGAAVVDPGLPGPKPHKVLERRLGDAGIPLRRVHTVLITHSHPDHFGGAGVLAERTGARTVTSDEFRLWWDPDQPDLMYMEIQVGRLKRYDRRSHELVDIRPVPAPGDPPERWNWDCRNWWEASASS